MDKINEEVDKLKWTTSSLDFFHLASSDLRMVIHNKEKSSDMSNKDYTTLDGQNEKSGITHIHIFKNHPKT